MRQRLFSLLLLALVAPAFAASSAPRETERIRIGNRKGGAIEVSLDGGRNWATIGRVLKPATDTGAGFAALSAAPPGTVAAVSLDGLLVRTDRSPEPRTAKPRIFSLLPAGGLAGAAGIATDVPRGHSLFGPLAPPVGAQLLLETPTGGTRPLPGGYIPQAGDHLVVVASTPADAPAILIFENRQGGRVLSVSPSGDETVVGQVRRPLRGVARYPATNGAACGGVVSHHPAAVVVATTPPGAAEAGGFLIQPAASAADARPEEGSLLVVDRLAQTGPAFGVPIALSPTGGSLAGETRAEVRLDGGPWEPLPAIGGAAPTAFTADALAKAFAALGAPRSLSDGITHLRLVLAPPSPERFREAVAQAAAESGARMAAAPAGTERPVSRPHAGTAPKRAGTGKGVPPHGRKGTLRVMANIQGQGIAYVMFYVDGRIRKMTNTPPFEWIWDTRSTPNGNHSLEIRGADSNGRILTTQTRQVTVYN